MPQTPPSLSRPAGLSINSRGILWMLLSAVGFACMGAVVKLLGQRLDPMQIVFFRALFVVIGVLPVLALTGWGHAVPLFPWRHVGRAATALSAMVCSFYALTHLPLATVTAITFACPLFVIIIAVLFLGETIRWRRWTATLAGFAGVLVMVRPGAVPAGLELAMAAALAHAIFVAASTTQVKAMPGQEKDVTLLFSFGAISTVVLAVPCWLVWQDPTAREWGLLLLVGLIGVGAQAAVIRAYRIGADASLVAPFDYARLLVAAAFGFSLFGEVPDVWTGIGASIIVGSTLYIAHRERVVKKPLTVAATPP
jgi:drug/metabolite transporter (DMT)-like permease